MVAVYRCKCGYTFEESLGAYGCPNCEGDSGPAVTTHRMVAFGEYSDDGTASAMKARDYKDATDLVAQPISIHPHCIGRAPEAGPHGKEYLLDGSAYCMDSRGQPQAVAQQYIGGVDYENNAHTMDQPTGPLLKGSPTGGGRPLPAIATSMMVRRLTPVECSRLQGFPDDYLSQVPWRGKATPPDGPMYKALGNSWAVPNVRWIGKRIQEALNALP